MALTEIPIPIIFQSVTELFKSRHKDNDTDKAIDLIRHGLVDIHSDLMVILQWRERLAESRRYRTVLYPRY